MRKSKGTIFGGEISRYRTKKSWNFFKNIFRTLYLFFPKNFFKLKRFHYQLRKEIKGFIKKPVRHVTHLSVVVVMLLVFLSNESSSNIFAKKGAGVVDPLGVTKVEQTDTVIREEVDSQITATLASVLREELAEDAFNIANEKANKVSMTVSSEDYLIKSPDMSVSGDFLKNEIKEYVVVDGDTLWSIARANNITTDTIRWANGITDIDSVSPGTKLAIPTTVGVLHTVKSGETIKGIASRYSASSAQIESFNNIIDEELVAGMRIMVPDGTGPELPKPEPEVPNNRNRDMGNTKYAQVPAPTYVATSSGPNRFPWGYCTWWVASKRYIPWNGNAWQWYGNARAYGRSTGNTPAPGAVMVTWESGVGHVAYVESVNGGSYTVSEMNYAGYGRVSRRTISPGQVPLIGFIY